MARTLTVDAFHCKGAVVPTYRHCHTMSDREALPQARHAPRVFSQNPHDSITKTSISFTSCLYRTTQSVVSVIVVKVVSMELACRQVVVAIYLLFATWSAVVLTTKGMCHAQSESSFESRRKPRAGHYRPRRDGLLGPNVRSGDVGFRSDRCVLGKVGCARRSNCGRQLHLESEGRAHCG